MSFDFQYDIGDARDADTDQQSQYRRAWSAVKESVITNTKEISIATIKSWYDRSQVLYRHTVYVPSTFRAQDDPEDYETDIDYHLGQLELKFAAQLWEDREQEARASGWTLAANHIVATAAACVNTNGVLTRAPTIQETWSAVWSEFATRLRQHSADERTLSRYEKIRGQLDSEAQTHHIHHKTPVWDPKKTAQWYCETIMEQIRQGRHKRVEAAWQPDPTNSQSAYSTMRSNVAANRDSYLPGQTSQSRWSGLNLAPYLHPNFVKAEENASENWVWVGTLGEGSAGIVSLWAKQNLSGVVTERIATKDVYLDDEEKWADENYWEGAMFNRYPREYAIARYCNDLPDSRNFVAHLEYALYEEYAMYRLYLEYCEHGDLQATISKHMTAGTRPSERAVWAMFEALATAVALMDQGQVPNSGSFPNHTPALHRDIKPQNLFLTNRDNKHKTWHMLPEAKLGDFDLSIWVAHPDSRKPGVGTEDYMSPEAGECKASDTDSHSDFHVVTQQSEIWSLGRTIMSLMNLEQDWILVPEYDIMASYKCDSTTGPTFDARAVTEYSSGLRNLVLKCLAPTPAHRPTPMALWSAIQAEAESMRNAQPASNEIRLLDPTMPVIQGLAQ